MGAPKTGGTIVGYCVGARGEPCGRPLAARKYSQQLGAWENYGSMRCITCARRAKRAAVKDGLRRDGRLRPPAPFPGPWVREALCAEVDGDLFFPEKGGTSKPAKLICRGCVVLAQCRSYVLEHGPFEGVWAGMSEPERRALAQAERAA